MDIQASARQKDNPVLCKIRRVKVDTSTESAELDLFDFIVNSSLRIPVLFLSMKFHSSFKEYFFHRVNHILTAPSVTTTPPVLLLLIDIEEVTAIESFLEEISLNCVLNNIRLLLAWSSVEAARILEILHVFGPDRAGDIARGNISTASQSASVETLLAQAKESIVTLQGGVGQKDSVQLINHFKSMKNLILATPAELTNVASIGTKKSNHISNIFTANWS